MRPDLDEYEELNTDANGEPRGRAMSWLVLGVAVIGFGALAYYAYQSGSKSVADGQMLVVNAEPGAIKTAPTDPGGEQFPHKDKTIYDALSPYRTDQQKVETLLPAPENPVIPEPAVGAGDTEKTGTTSYVNKDAAAADDADDAMDDDSADDAAAGDRVAASEEDESKPEAASVAKPIAPAAAPAVAEPAKPAPAAAAVKETPVVTPAPKAEPAVAPAAPVAKTEAPAPKKAEAKPAEKKPVTATGEYKIQLGAYGSDAEARQTWKKIAAKNGDVLKGSPIVVKADVGGKTFYRLRASGFVSADAAKKACVTLSGRGQACFPAGK